MKCSSCGYQLQTSKICPSCGHDNREKRTEQPVYMPENLGDEVQKAVKEKRSICESCGYKIQAGMMCPSCGHYNRSEKTQEEIYVPENVKERNPEDQESVFYRSEDTAFLRRWLSILFWLIIPSTVSVIISFMGPVTMLVLVGGLLRILSYLAYGIILIILSKIESGYRPAGILYLVSMAFTILAVQESSISLIFNIINLIISFLAMYYEYKSHSNIVAGIDNVLSTSWDGLWKWTIGLCIAVIVAVFMIIIIPFLAALIMLVVSLGFIIISIAKIVFLYRTARCF